MSITVNTDDAQETIATAWNKGIRYYDTAPFYGSDMAEERLGTFLKEKKREEFIIAIKVGRLLLILIKEMKNLKGKTLVKNLFLI